MQGWVGHVGVGWGGVGHEFQGCSSQKMFWGGWGGSYRGWVGHDGVGHAGVGQVM